MLKVDGKEVATRKMEHTLSVILQWDKTFDIGSDTGTPVDDRDYQVPFNFTGKLNKLMLTINRPKLTPEDITYAAAVTEGTIGEGAGVTTMKNENGVVIQLISTTQGVNFKLAGEGVRFTLEK